MFFLLKAVGLLEYFEVIEKNSTIVITSKSIYNRIALFYNLSEAEPINVLIIFQADEMD